MGLSFLSQTCTSYYMVLHNLHYFSGFVSIEAGDNLGWKGLRRSSGPRPCSKQVLLDQVAQSCVQSSLEHLQWQGLHTLSGWPAPVFDHLHHFEKKSFLVFDIPSVITTCVHCLLSYCCALPRGIWLCLSPLIRQQYSFCFIFSSPGWASLAPSVSQLQHSTKLAASLGFAPVCPHLCCNWEPQIGNSTTDVGNNTQVPNKGDHHP